MLSRRRASWQSLTQPSSTGSYLNPVLVDYLRGFFKGFDDSLGKAAKPSVEFMTSEGTLVDVKNFSGLRSILCASLASRRRCGRGSSSSLACTDADARVHSGTCWRCRWLLAHFVG